MILMGEMDITIWFAFSAGVLSFFSPCVFPLVPAYIANLTGSTIEDNRMKISRATVFTRSISFIIGFSIIFIILGASASLIGQIFSEYRSLIEKIGGIIIVLFGFQMIGWLNFKFLMKEKRAQMKPSQKGNIWRSGLMGIVFAAGWSPCVGLALGSIMFLAGSAATLGSGIFLLIVYSLGFAIPFLIIAFAVTYSLRIIKSVNKWLPALSKASGALLIILGIMLYTGQLYKLSAWLNYTFT